MIKRISLLLVAVLLLGALSVSFVGCTNGNADGEDTVNTSGNTQETGEGYVADGLPSKNFGGDKVIILTPTWRNTPDYILQKELKGEAVNSAMVSAYYAVKERFNVEIELSIPGDQKVVQSTVESETLAGEKSFDIVYNHDLRTVANAVNGCFLDIKSMELVDLEKPWWTKSSKDFQVSNKLYFTSSYLGIWAPYMNFGLYYNKNLARDNQITMPYDDIIAGEWYIEDMIQMTQNMNNDLDGNGEINEKDRYGFVTGYHGNVSAQTNLVGSFLSKDSKGNDTIKVDVEKFSGFMQTMSKLYDNGSDDYSDFINIFTAGRSLFVFTETRILVENRNDITFSWGMIPFPKYDENQEEYSSAGYDLYWGVNRNVFDRQEIVATVIEALSCQNYNNVIPVVWEEFLGLKLSENQIDYNMVCIVRDASFVNPDYVYGDQILGMSDLLNLWESSDVSSLSSHITAKTSLAKVSLKLFVDKIKALP